MQNHKKKITDHLGLHTLYYTQKKRFSALAMIHFVLSHVIEIWPNYGQLTVLKNLHSRIRKLSEGLKIIGRFEKNSLGAMGRYCSSEVSKF